MDSSTEKKINSIVSARKNNIPLVENKKDKVLESKNKVSEIIYSLKRLNKSTKNLDEEYLEKLKEIQCELLKIEKLYDESWNNLCNLKKRFSRNTVNIGVSGEARVGKSTTLQSFSGLTDVQIPTGKSIPVTAVRSEIFNNAEEFAEIQFRDERSFIEEYLKPHINNINKAGSLKISINNLSELAHVDIPDTLGNNVDSKSSNSLNELKSAQESLLTYSQYLTGEIKKESLENIRKFVAYPSKEERKQKAPNRSYLAVKSVKIYSKFPSLNNEKMGLIDLPGLGEIGDSVATIHTTGLEDEVDQIVLVMRPTQDEGYVKSGIAQNIDQLRKIQRGVSSRSDLLVATINHDDTNEESAITLREDFEKIINQAQINDKITIKDYNALNNESVQQLFEYLLDKLVESLPKMDKDVLDYICGESYDSINKEYNNICNKLNSIVSNVLKAIPIEDNYLDNLADTLSRTLISEYDDLEKDKLSQVNNKNELRKVLEKQVNEIYYRNTELIEKGLFFSTLDKWKSYAKGRSDYVIFYREEAKRIKAEIADSYRDIDIFYDSAINDLKNEVLSIFINNTGGFCESINVGLEEDVNSNLSKLSNELDAITRDEEFSHCFNFISTVKFKFSQNVFYNIYKSLENLHNPEVNMSLGDRCMKSAELINLTYTDLVKMAESGNKEIRNKILEYNDNFNRFLFTCMTFFNDFLFRKNNRKFVNNMRILIKENRECFIPEDEIEIDKDIQKSLNNLKNIIKGSYEVKDNQTSFSKNFSLGNTKKKIFSTKENENNPITVTNKSTQAAKKKNEVIKKKNKKRKTSYKGSYEMDW